MAGLQYIRGYVLNKLHQKHAQSKSSKLPESQQAISILKAGRDSAVARGGAVPPPQFFT